MPRIYANNEAHDFRWGGVSFVQGVGAVAASKDTSFFGHGYTIDNSKHSRVLLDDLTPAQLRAMAGYLGVTVDEGDDPDSKHTLVRAIEGSISTKYIAAVTVASAAGTDGGETKITITGAGTYKYKTATDVAPAPFYMDDVNGWDDIETGDEFEPIEGHNKITVVRVNTAGLVIGIGTDDITVKVS